MGQIEELKVFVSERLHAAASDILGAIEKTITDYEEQTSRLKEENDRHRSLLDILVKAKLPQAAEAGHSTKVIPAAADPRQPDSSPTRKTTETPCYSSDLQCVFTSRTDFLKFAANGNCPYCFKRIQATETHLMRKHYLFAVHFTEDGTEKFVVPCTCKDRIQGRSHWHCPFCRKIIYRKCNFEGHISKQHGYAILQQSQDTEMDQPSVSAFKEEVPLSPEPWCEQGLCSPHPEDQQASLLLQIKEEGEQEIWRQVSHPDLQYSEQLQITGEQIQKGNSQLEEQSLEPDHAQDSTLNIVCVDSYFQDPSEINCVESGQAHPQTQSDSGVSDIWQRAGKSQHTTEDRAVAVKNHAPCSSIKGLKSKRKKLVKRSFPSLSLNIKKSAGSHCCKSCGKTFHYMNTLRKHAQAHTVDNTHICGICGKHFESTESLVQHLQSYTKRNECAICGKQFSSNSRLRRHRRFHRPKGLNVMSSAYKPQMGEIRQMS